MPVSEYCCKIDTLLLKKQSRKSLSACSLQMHISNTPIAITATPPGRNKIVIFFQSKDNFSEIFLQFFPDTFAVSNLNYY